MYIFIFQVAVLLDLENILDILQPFREKMSGDESYIIQPARERNISLKECGFRATSSSPYNACQTGTWEVRFVFI